MSHLMTNQQNDMYAQRWPWSAWASAQSDQSSLSAWRNLGPLATLWAHREDPDQTGWLPRLIWVFAGQTCHFVGFVMKRLIYLLDRDFSRTPSRQWHWWGQTNKPWYHDCSFHASVLSISHRTQTIDKLLVYCCTLLQAEAIFNGQVFCGLAFTSESQLCLMVV